jgi:hypothetical protein
MTRLGSLLLSFGSATIRSLEDNDEPLSSSSTSTTIRSLEDSDKPLSLSSTRDQLKINKRNLPGSSSSSTTQEKRAKMMMNQNFNSKTL